MPCSGSEEMVKVSAVLAELLGAGGATNCAEQLATHLHVLQRLSRLQLSRR